VEDFYVPLELLEGTTLQWATPQLESEDIKQLKSVNDDIRKISRKGRNCIAARIPLETALSRPFQKEVRKRQIN
jgi:DNA-binding GntR family transcriptional regulator